MFQRIRQVVIARIVLFRVFFKKYQNCTFHGTEGVYFLCPEGGDGKWKMVFFKKKEEIGTKLGQKILFS